MKNIQSTSQDLRTKKSLKTTSIGISGNFILAFFKIALGIISNSIALIGDGTETLVDGVESIFVYKSIEIAAKPADDEHPFGHGRAETIASAMIGITLIFAGVLIIIESFNSWNQKADGFLMIIGAIISIGSKWILAYYTQFMGKKYENTVLSDNGKHYFSDVLASLAVLIGGVMIYITGLEFFDNIASLIVALFIIYIGIDILRPVEAEIMEKQQNPEIVEGIKQIASNFSIFNPHDIRISKHGPYYIIDMHAELPKNISLEKAHTLSTEFEDRVKSTFPQIKDINVHLEPIEDKGSLLLNYGFRYHRFRYHKRRYQ